MSPRLLVLWFLAFLILTRVLRKGMTMQEAYVLFQRYDLEESGRCQFIELEIVSTC